MVRIVEAGEDCRVKIEKADLLKDRECFSVPLDHCTERYLAGRERGVKLEKRVFLSARFAVSIWEGDKWTRNRPRNGGKARRAAVRAEGTVYLTQEAWVEYVTHWALGWYLEDHVELRVLPILRRIFEEVPLQHSLPFRLRVTCARDEEYPRTAGCVQTIFPAYVFRRVCGEGAEYEKVVKSIRRERRKGMSFRSLHWFYSYCVDNPVPYGVREDRIRERISLESERDHEGGRGYQYQRVSGVRQKVE